MGLFLVILTIYFLKGTLEMMKSEMLGNKEIQVFLSIRLHSKREWNVVLGVVCQSSQVM